MFGLRGSAGRQRISRAIGDPSSRAHFVRRPCDNGGMSFAVEVFKRWGALRLAMLPRRPRENGRPTVEVSDMPDVQWRTAR